MTLGMVFAGGGVRGAAELGVAQALYEKGVKPTVFAGTSAGSIVATMLALGYEPEKAFEKFSMVNDHLLDIAYGQIFESVIFHHLLLGLVKGDRLEELLDAIFDGKKLKEASNLGIVTTDLTTGSQVAFIANESAPDVKLSFAVRSSCSLPLVFEPKQYGDMLLVDGGLVNNVPSNIVRQLGATEVITVDLGYTGTRRGINNLFDVASQTLDVMMAGINKDNVDNEDHGIYLNPQVEDIGALDFKDIQSLYKRGYEYGKNIADSVQKSLDLMK